MINLLRPKFFVPVHGDYRHLKRHAELAAVDGHRRKGHPARRWRNPGRRQDERAAKTGKVTVGRVCIDSGGSIEVVEDIIIRDRQHISEGGIVLPIMTINKHTGKVENAARDRHARVRGGRSRV